MNLEPDCTSAGDSTLALTVASLLRQARQTVAVAESCTGGALCRLLTDAAGASDFFLGGVVAYSDSVKRVALGVGAATLEQHGAVSALVAAEMSQNVRLRLGADWGVAITGIAGPGGGTSAKPVGTVFVALTEPEGASVVCSYRLDGDRLQVRRASAREALEMLRRRLTPGGALE